jgi:hypothetical protein
MQTARIILASALALALSGISILCCYVFGTHLAAGQEGQIYGILGGVADALKAILPIGIAAAWVAKERGRAVAGAALFLIFSAYSFASELGLYALSRDAQAGNMLAGKESLELIKADRARIQDRLKGLGQTRPSAQIEADRSAARQSRLWAQSGECKEAARGAARIFCADYEKLQGELAASTEAEKLRADDATLSQKLSGIDLAAALRSGDPQSEALARFTGFAPATIRDALAILVALLIELGSGFGLWIATAGIGHRDSKASSAAGCSGLQQRAFSGQPGGAGGPSAPACADGIAPAKRGKPIDPVKAFLKACCSERKGAEATASDLHRAFQVWAANKDQGHLSQKALGTRLNELGFERVKRGGIVRYSGLTIT